MSLISVVFAQADTLWIVSRICRRMYKKVSASVDRAPPLLFDVGEWAAGSPFWDSNENFQVLIIERGLLVLFRSPLNKQ